MTAQPSCKWPRQRLQRLFIFTVSWALAFSTILSCHAFKLGKRDLTLLSANQVAALVSSPDPSKNLDPSNSNSHLSKILIPRAPDTENSTLVRQYIVSTLRALDWHVEEDTFTDNTPIGPKRFTNVIATHDPDASRRVILSAHFDSKYFPVYPLNQFVGATDSAASCAMMLDLAEALSPLLNARKQRLEHGLEDDEDVSDTTLQLVFFDGEEAFIQWTEVDSVYGARHLVEKWANTYLSPHSKRRLFFPSGYTQLSTIEHLILLDLLGAPNPLVQSYFIDTAWLFDGLVTAETRLRDSGALNSAGKNANDGWRSFFIPRTSVGMNHGYILDDHVPFMKKGVSVVHIIPNPFPAVWHTLQDDASSLDLPCMRRWNLILRVFLSEYLLLKPPTIGQRKSNEELMEFTGAL